MKRVLFCAVSFGIMLGCGVSRGEDLHLKALEPFIGHWNVTGAVNWAGKEAEPIVARRTFEWTLGGNFIQTTMTAIDEGKPALRHRSMIGWDPKTEQIKEWGFWNAATPDGSSGWAEVVTWSKVDGKWHIKNDAIDEAFYTVVDQDTHKYQCSFRGKDGSKNSWQFLAKRAQEMTAEEAGKWLKYIQGEWTTVWDDGLTVDAKWEFVAGNHVLIGHFVGSDGKKAAEIAGWQPRSKAIIVTGFGEAGNNWHLKYTDSNDNSLRGTITGTLPDGKSMHGTFVLQKIDDSNFEFQFKGTADGEAIELIGKNRRKG